MTKSNFIKTAQSLAKILLIAAISIFALAALKVYFHGKLPAGVILNGNSLSSLSNFEIEEQIAEKIKNFEKKEYLVKINGQDLKFSASDLGFSGNFEKTKEELLHFDARRDGLVSLITASFASKDEEIAYDLDYRKAKNNLEEKLNISEQRATNAAFSFDEEGKLIVIPERKGKKISQTELREQLNKLANKEVESIELNIVEEQPSLKTADLLQSKEELEEKLKKNIKLKYERQNWDFKPLDHLDWISFEATRKIHLKDLNKEFLFDASGENILNEIYEIKPEIKAKISTDFDTYAEENFASKINEDMQEAKIFYNEKDKIVIEGSAQDGQIMHAQRLREMLEIAINEEISSLNIPVKTVKAKVQADEKLQEQGVKELVAIGHTTFFGSPANRQHNIAIGMSKYNTLLIKQGEEFSFNKFLGVVDGSTGYKKELVIKGDEGTIPEYGGGLCQDSTTFYRAALNAGLPVTERKPHSYAVGYYAQILGHGLDATIYPGVSDLKFINDTPGDLVVQSYAKGGHAYVKLYGSSDGRTTRLEGPYISNRKAAPPDLIFETTELPAGARKTKEKAHGGFDASWNYYVTKDGKTTKETIFSQYNAVPARILVGVEAE